MVKAWTSITIAERSAILIGMLERLGEVQKHRPNETMWLSPNLGQILFAILMDCEYCGCEHGAEIDHMHLAIRFCLEAFMGREGPLHDNLPEEQREAIAKEQTIADINVIAMTDLMLTMLMLIRAGHGPQGPGGKRRRVHEVDHAERSVVSRLFGRLLPSPQTNPV